MRDSTSAPPSVVSGAARGNGSLVAAVLVLVAGIGAVIYFAFVNTDFGAPASAPAEASSAKDNAK